MSDEQPVTNLEKGGPAKRRRAWVTNAVEAVVPFVLPGLIGFYSYAYAYVVVWGRVRRHSRGVAIALLVLYGFLVAYVCLVWCLLRWPGPGKVDENYPLAGTDDDAFLCDAQGYALWCSYCEHVKPSKTHHSSKTDTCIPVMDHYCIWIGTCVGQGNRKFFLQFCLGVLCVLVLILVTLLVYQHDRLPKITALAIPLYVLTGFWLIFDGPIVVVHIRYLILDQTTLDTLDRKRNAPVHINLPVGDLRRVVTITDPKELVPGPFHQGYWQNFVSVMGPPWSWLLPIRQPLREPKFNETVIARLQERARKEMEQETASTQCEPSVRTAAPKKRRRLCV